MITTKMMVMKMMIKRSTEKMYKKMTTKLIKIKQRTLL